MKFRIWTIMMLALVLSSASLLRADPVSWNVQIGLGIPARVVFVPGCDRPVLVMDREDCGWHRGWYRYRDARDEDDRFYGDRDRDDRCAYRYWHERWERRHFDHDDDDEDDD